MRINAIEKHFFVYHLSLSTHNHDDHAKNFSFLMDEEGSWRVSPAYDLTFSSGPAGEHCTTIMGEGKNPTLFHLLKLADIGGIKKPQARQIIDGVKSAVDKWNIFAEQAGVRKDSVNRIQEIFNYIARNS